MKTLLTVVVLAASLFVISCNTCTTCTYETKSGEEITEEVCGNSTKTKEFRKEIEDAAYINRSKFDCNEDY